MAVVPFGYQNMQNQLGVNIAQNTNQMYKDQIDKTRQNNLEDYKLYQEESDRQSLARAFANSVNEDGSINQKGLVSQLGQVNPEAALKLQNSIGQQENNIRKTNADIMRAQAQANAQEAVAKSNNLKIAQGVVTDLSNQLAQSTPENWDSTVSQARKMAQTYGVELPAAFSEGYSEDKRSQAMSAAMSLKDKVDTDLKQHQQLIDDGRYNLDVFKTNNQVKNQDAQLDIQQQNANTSARNADVAQRNSDINMQNSQTNAQRLQNDQAKVQQQKIATQQKQYQSDVSDFQKAKTDYQQSISGLTSNQQTLNNSLSTVSDALSRLSSNPKLQGTSLSKGAKLWSNITGSSNEYNDYQAVIDNISAGNFLTAIQAMKGFGALSNTEGETLRKAVAPIGDNISVGQMRNSLNTIRDILNKKIGNLNQEAQTAKANLAQKAQMLKSKYSGGQQSNTLTPTSLPVADPISNTVPVPDDDATDSTMGSQLGM